MLNGLFCVNERVTLFGRWRHGFFSLTMVGATNVGTVLLTHEPVRPPPTVVASSQRTTHARAQRLVTNVFPPLQRTHYDGAFGSNVVVSAGDEVAFFNLGSTVVMIFEAPASFEFSIKNGDKVQLGQRIGTMLE